MTTIQTGWTEGLTLHQARITATEAERPSFRDDGISMHRDADQWAAVICAMFDSTGGRARACAIRIERESSAAQVDESPYHHPFGLAMALAVAAESGALKTPCDRLYGWGTMDPAGRLTPTRGELLAAEYATAEGLDFVAASVPGGGSALILDSYYHALTIKALVDSLNRKEQAPAENAAEGPTVHSLDALAGQPRVLRALEIAAAGRHPLLIAGSNRATVRAASRLPAALPRPTAAERLETARNHSAAGFAWSGKLVGGPRAVRPPLFRVPRGLRERFERRRVRTCPQRRARTLGSPGVQRADHRRGRNRPARRRSAGAAPGRRGDSRLAGPLPLRRYHHDQHRWHHRRLQPAGGRPTTRALRDGGTSRPAGDRQNRRHDGSDRTNA